MCIGCGFLLVAVVYTHCCHSVHVFYLSLSQICFMNESPCDTDNEGLSPRPHEIHDNTKLKESSLVDSDVSIELYSEDLQAILK